MEQVIKILEIQKQIYVTRSYEDKPNQQYTLIAHDNQNEFSIKVIQLKSNQSEEISEERIDYARQLALSIKSCKHENIAKYLGEFQIEEYYFIVLERIEINLIDWQKINRLKKKIKRDVFISFALQLIRAVEHIHSQNYILHDLALKNIFLDKENKIKLSDFGIPQEVIPSQLSKQFMEQKVENTQFYIPPELFDFSKDKIARQFKELPRKEGDIWVICTCLYALAEGTLIFIKRLTRGTGFYLFVDKIDLDINKTLMNCFWININLRPTISDLIQYFQDLQKVQVEQKEEEEEEYYDEEYIDKFIKGKQLYNNENFEESVQVLQEAFKINPSSYLTLYFIGNCYFERKNYEKAIDYYLKSIEVYPNNSISYKSIGHCYLNLKQFETAIENLQKSLKINPEYSHAYNLLGVCYHNLAETESAAESYMKANSLCPQQSIPLFNLGNIYLKKKMSEESQKWYQLAIKTNPNYIDAYTNLGVVNCEQNQFEQALIYFEKASLIDPSSPSINHNIWYACMKMNKYDHAINFFKNMLKFKESQQTNYYLALTLIQQDGEKNMNKSIHYLKQEIKQEPQIVEPYYLLIDSFYEKQKYPQILKYIKLFKRHDYTILERQSEAKSEI